MKIRVKKQLVEFECSAEEWELFTHEYPHECEAAARKMNSTLRECFNSGMSYTDTVRTMGTLMQSYSYLGACDTEPAVHLSDVLDKLYEIGY